jgi:CHAT domain-containing protein
VDVLVEQLKSSYPEYFRFLYNPGIASADDIKAFCKAQKLQWLHFADLADGRFATILFTPDTITIRSSTGKFDSLEVYRKALVESIQNRDWNFRKPAHELYNLLIGGHAAFLKPGTLYISSAGYLDNIPFDLLLTAPADHLPLEQVAQYYLVQQFAIALIPSGTFGMTTWEPNITVKRSVFIAPEYIHRSLQHSAPEAQAGSKLLDGTFVAGAPEKEVTLAWLRETDLLHFAGHSYTHASNLDSIFLLLGDGNDTLFLSSLFTTQSAARLAVLSSCFSATGQKSREGNIGLAYGFSFAGTPQVISSLWAVSDRETSEVFGKFYRDFASGKNSIESLHKAKLHYLNNAPLPGRHPYFWANWVYYGHPVKFGNVESLWRLLWIPAFMLALFMIVRFRKRTL